PRRQGWSFHTKLELAADLVTWAAGWARFAGRAVRAVADGFYAKRPFLKPAAAAGVTVVRRLRRDAGVRTRPVPPRGGRRRRGRARAGRAGGVGGGPHQPGKARRGGAGRGGGARPPVRGGAREAHQDLPGDVAAGRGRDPGGDRARRVRLAGAVQHRPG